MILWSQIFLILSCVLSAVYIYRRLDHSPLFYLLSNLTLLGLVLGHILKLTNPGFLDYTIEIVFLATLLLTLITLMVTVRLFQPDHVRYPIIYSYVPILILPFYLFYIDNQSLSDLLEIILHTTGYIVFMVIIIVHHKDVKKNWLLFLSLLFFLFSIIFYWVLNVEYEWIGTFTNLLLAAGIISGSMSFPGLINKTSHKNKK